MGVSQVNFKPISCKNCGHPRHCEGPLYLENKMYQDGGYEEYKACNKCRCDQCTPEQDAKKDIPGSMLNGL